MASGTNLEQDILQCRLNACAERRAGNPLAAAGWDAEAEALTDRLVLLTTQAQWTQALVDNRHG